MTHDAKLVAEAFKLPRPLAGKTSPAMLQGSDQRFALLELTAVTDIDVKNVDAAARDAARASLKSGLASSDNEALRDALRKRVAIVVHEDRHLDRRAWTETKKAPEAPFSLSAGSGSNTGHAENAVAGVDVADLAGDAGGEVGAKERADVADLLDGDIAT